MHSRYAVAAVAAYPRVLIQDDDLRLSPAGYKRLLQEQEKDPDVIHGVFGRWPNTEDHFSAPPSYVSSRSPVRAPILLSRLLCFRRDLVAPFFAAAPAMDYVQWKHKAKPFWTGEDVVFSLSVVRYNRGKLNLAHGYLAQEVSAQVEDVAPSISAQDSQGGAQDVLATPKMDPLVRKVVVDEAFTHLGLVVPDPLHDTETLSVVATKGLLGLEDGGERAHLPVPSIPPGPKK